MKFVRGLLVQQLSLFVLASIFYVTLYVVAQQSERHALNDPQTTMVDSVGHALEANATVQSLIPSSNVDIEKELSPWLVVYDKNFSPSLGNGYFEGSLAVVPPGVLTNGVAGITNRITWQPKKGVRQALVVYTVPRVEGTVYVVSGRSMSEGERRIALYGMLALVGWLISMLALVCSVLFQDQLKRALS